MAHKGTRDTAGGFYLPNNDEEKKVFLDRKKNEVITCLETILSIEYGKKKALDEETKNLIRAL